MLLHANGRPAGRADRRDGRRSVETKNAALAAPDEVIERLSKEVELVLTGSAD